MYKVIFLGTSGFAVPILEILAKSRDFDVQLVISQPDAPMSRKKILTPTPIKTAAEKLNLKIFTPEKIKDQEIIKKISSLKPDFLILAAYGQILPKELLTCAKYGAINIHPSLLPKYRGPSPVQYAILNGDEETGVSIILMDEEIDHGLILAQKTLKILPDETTPELKARLAEISANLLLVALPQFANGKIKAQIQDHARATFTKILKRADGHIHWKESAQKIYNQWMALQPWPGIYTETEKQGSQETKRIILNKIKLANNVVVDMQKLKAGGVFAKNGRLLVSCGQGVIELQRLQLEGKKEISAQEFLNGYPEIVGRILV